MREERSRREDEMRSSEGGEGQADTQRRIQIPVLVHAEPAAVPSVAAAAPPAALFAAPAPQPTTQPVRPAVCCLTRLYLSPILQ